MHLNTEITAMPDSDKRRQTAAAAALAGQDVGVEAGKEECWCLSANFPEFYDSELVYSGTFIILHVKVGGSKGVTGVESSSEELIRPRGSFVVESPEASGCCCNFLLRLDANSVGSPPDIGAARFLQGGSVCDSKWV